jgi:hypothetical protein
MMLAVADLVVFQIQICLRWDEDELEKPLFEAFSCLAKLKVPATEYDQLGE